MLAPVDDAAERMGLGMVDQREMSPVPFTLEAPATSGDVAPSAVPLVAGECADHVEAELASIAAPPAFQPVACDYGNCTGEALGGGTPRIDSDNDTAFMQTPAWEALADFLAPPGGDAHVLRPPVALACQSPPGAFAFAGGVP